MGQISLCYLNTREVATLDQLLVLEVVNGHHYSTLMGTSSKAIFIMSLKIESSHNKIVYTVTILTFLLNTFVHSNRQYCLYITQFIYIAIYSKNSLMAIALVAGGGGGFFVSSVPNDMCLKIIVKILATVAEIQYGIAICQIFTLVF
jgi:hypothetical protein